MLEKDRGNRCGVGSRHRLLGLSHALTVCRAPVCLIQVSHTKIKWTGEEHALTLRALIASKRASEKTAFVLREMTTADVPRTGVEVNDGLAGLKTRLEGQTNVAPEGRSERTGSPLIAIEWAVDDSLSGSNTPIGCPAAATLRHQVMKSKR